MILILVDRHAELKKEITVRSLASLSARIMLTILNSIQRNHSINTWKTVSNHANTQAMRRKSARITMSTAQISVVMIQKTHAIKHVRLKSQDLKWANAVKNVRAKWPRSILKVQGTNSNTGIAAMLNVKEFRGVVMTNAEQGLV